MLRTDRKERRSLSHGNISEPCAAPTCDVLGLVLPCTMCATLAGHQLRPLSLVSQHLYP